MIRIFDFIFSLLGIALLSPIFVILSIAIVLDSRGGAFYSQIRVGKNNTNFKLYKFRSMSIGADKKGLITVGGRDTRITRVGYFIRKYKLDELPQLFNVLLGQMSLVGPRPEVRKYVDQYTLEQKIVLSVKPGITDYASIEYIDENEILSKSTNPDLDYINIIVPDKIKYNMKYINNRSLKEYFTILFITFFSILKK